MEPKNHFFFPEALREFPGKSEANLVPRVLTGQREMIMGTKLPSLVPSPSWWSLLFVTISFDLTFFVDWEVFLIVFKELTSM